MSAHDSLCQVNCISTNSLLENTTLSKSRMLWSTENSWWVERVSRASGCSLQKNHLIVSPYLITFTCWVMVVIKPKLTLALKYMYNYEQTNIRPQIIFIQHFVALAAQDSSVLDCLWREAFQHLSFVLIPSWQAISKVNFLFI